MNYKVLKVHPADNVIVALIDLKKNEEVWYENELFVIQKDIAAKHKFAEKEFSSGEEIIMYGVLVGKAQSPIAKGEWITTFNVKHASSEYNLGQRNLDWQIPDVKEYEN